MVYSGGKQMLFSSCRIDLQVYNMQEQTALTNQNEHWTEMHEERIPINIRIRATYNPR